MAANYILESFELVASLFACSFPLKEKKKLF